MSIECDVCVIVAHKYKTNNLIDEFLVTKKNYTNTTNERTNERI